MEFKDRLRIARTRAGLSMADLGGKLRAPVSAQSINKYEKGDMMPSSGTLHDLSVALNVSLDFLMKGQVVELADVDFRKRASVSERDKSIIKHDVLEFLERCIAVEELLGEDNQVTGFDAVVAEEIDTIDDAEDVASRIRAEWSLGNEPIPSLTNLLEERNIRVQEISGAEGFFGMTCRVKRAGNKPQVPVIVRRHVNVERDRFTTAHEIAHAFIGGCRLGKLEKAIDRCAGALLMPADSLIRELGPHRGMIAYAEIVKLKHLYGVSAMALLYRLRDLGIVSDQAFKGMFRNPRIRGWLKTEPEPLDNNGEMAKNERPRRFESMVLRAASEGMIRSNRAAELLGWQVAKVEECIWGPRAA